MAEPRVDFPAEDLLLAQATSGEVDALSTLLKRHGPRVRRELSIADKWRSVIDADDVMQATYVEAYLRIGSFTPQGPKSFPAWLRQIAQNNLRDAIKGLDRDKRPPPAKRVESPQGEDSVVALYDLLGVSTATPSRAAARQEADGMLEAAIQELPPDYALAVRLFDLEGRSGPEVAAAMGRSRGAAFMLRARAHDRLREILGSASRFFSTGS